jgi:type II secretory pathway component GspD/PulD (secretin)
VIETETSSATTTETTTYTQKISEGADSVSELEKQVLKDIEDEKNRQKYASLAKTLKRPEADFIKLYSEYGDVLAGLNPNNPKDLAEIEKLIEIVGVPKRESNLKPSPTLKQAKFDDPIVNFSARNVPVRDAFATLARVSGMSITVSGQIGDRDLISVVEINNQPFTKAFLSLVEAADVDFSASGNSFTILKRKGQRTTSLSASIDSTDIDLTKALEDRYADLIYDNEDLSSIIKDLANKYGVDVVMTATPTDRITLRVRGVNIEDAFELIFAGSQFGYTRKDDTFIVYSTTNKNFGLDRKTILFPLKYLEAQQAQKLLPAEIKDKVQISETQNAFIASGSKMELTQLYDFIRTIDRPIPQVEFNVQLVEVSRDFSRSVGLLQDQFSLGKIGNLSDTGLNFGWNSSLNEDNISVFQNRPTYNQSSGTSQIKVNQRLLVTSGKSAKINFDEDRNILLNAGSSTGQNIGVVQQQNIQRITAGNSMDITPVVGGGGVVTVKVEVEVSANNDINNTTGIPRTTVRRRLSSVIQITNNETIAIGGLFDNRKSLGNKNELPLISRLPVIGQLFTNQGSKNKNLKELIILITPHIKTGDEKEQVYIQAEGGI